MTSISRNETQYRQLLSAQTKHIRLGQHRADITELDFVKNTQQKNGYPSMFIDIERAYLHGKKKTLRKQLYYIIGSAEALPILCMSDFCE